jgi:LacI family transcriptional regulator
MKVTRDDVAKKAGVSSAVVSYVLNNGPRPVAPETKQRVIQAIEELGYRTNLIASSLRAKRTHTLGLIIPDISNIYYSELAKGVEDYAYKHGYTVNLGSTNDEDQIRTSHVENFTSRKVEGIIFANMEVNSKELELLNDYNIPAVYIIPESVIDEEMQKKISCISVDLEKGGYMVGKHLLEKGHQKFACVTGGTPQPESNLWSWQRVNGFIKAIQEEGFTVDIIQSIDHPEDGYRAGISILQKENRPSAIFAGNDLLAIGVLRAASDLQINVPSELAICGFDDISLTNYVIPRLTTVRIEKYKQGWEAARMILGRLDEIRRKVPREDERPDYKYQQFNPQLIIRESS